MTKFYMSDVGLFLVVVCVFIFAGLAWNFSKRNSNWRVYRVPITGVVVLMTIAVMTWDVVLTSVKMAEICPTAKLVVKRSVKVDGFYTNFGSPDMLKNSFKYLESRNFGNQILVYVRTGDSVEKQEFDARNYVIKSRYEYIYDEVTGSFEGRRDISIQKSIVRDRQTGEELGHAVRFKAYPGWVDRNTVARIAQILWMCHSHMDQEIQLRRQALLSN